DSAASLPGENHRLDGHAVGCRPRRDSHRMTDRAAAKLQDNVLAEKIEQLVHLPRMDAAGGNWHQLVQRGPWLIEEETTGEILRIIILAADIVIAARCMGIAFQLADHGSGMNVIDRSEE